MSSEPPNTDDSDGPTTDETNEVETAATVSSDYKTRGKKAATSGAGVLGYNTATSGEAYGVEGVTDSSDFNAAAVRAIANNGAVGLETTANGNYAVDAFTSGYTAIDGTTDGGGYNGLKEPV